MNNTRVAILRGGPSDEYSVSMRTGQSVLNALRHKDIYAKDIVVTKNREWLEDGKNRDENSVFTGIDVVFIAMHGSFSEDGEIQKILQRNKIPFTGSSSLSSAIAFNKALTKDILSKQGILTPKYKLVSKESLDVRELIKEIRAEFDSEYIIKPVSNGSSIGTILVKNPDLLERSLEEAFNYSDNLMIEEFIRGREVTSAVLEDFRDKEIYAFPAVEIITPRESPFYTYEAKYSGKTEFVCPSNFSYRERDQIANISEQVHRILNLSQYSRSDFIVRDKKIYFLEVNTLPGLTKESIYPKAAKAVGLEFEDLIEHLLNTATC